MNRLVPALLLAAFSVAGCGSQPAVPEWQREARAALDAYQRHFLRGESRLADRALERARDELSATGRSAEIARASIVRCALVGASADPSGCAAGDVPAAALSTEDRAYWRFILGDWNGLDASALPERYRSLVRAGGTEARIREMRSIDDPLSRLVAAGSLLRRAELPREGVGIAVETAADQGYRRPLAGWLAVEAALAEQSGDLAAAEAARKRLAIVLPVPQ